MRISLVSTKEEEEEEEIIQTTHTRFFAKRILWWGALRSRVRDYWWKTEKSGEKTIFENVIIRVSNVHFIRNEQTAYPGAGRKVDTKGISSAMSASLHNW
jgi:hypothetical protein